MFHSKTSDCAVPTANCQLPTANCPLPTAHCQLPTANRPLPTAHCPRLPALHRLLAQHSMAHMLAKRLTPILNVSNIAESFAWFEKLGWKKAWEWGDPPDFGGVCSGDCEIFLCENGQGGRGKGAGMTFGPEGDQSADKGAWMCILVEDVDAVYQRCLAEGLEVTWPPTDMPWHLREMHVRHPDGHVFRIGHGLEDDDDTDEPEAASTA